MIVDKETLLATATAFDLESISNDIGPGPGQPVLMVANNLPDATYDVTHCDTVGGTYTACVSFTVAGETVVEFRLPSNTMQFIKVTFASGDIFAAMEGNQIAV